VQAGAAVYAAEDAPGAAGTKEGADGDLQDDVGGEGHDARDDAVAVAERRWATAAAGCVTATGS